MAFRFLPTGNEVMVSWAFDIAAGTTMTSGETIVTVNSKFAYSDTKIIGGNYLGGDLTGNVYAPAAVNTAAAFQYRGPSYDSYDGSSTSYWYGQGIYTLSLG